MAISVLAETLKRNVYLISQEKQQFDKISGLLTILQSLVEAIDPINTQNDETPGKQNLKNVLRYVIDDECDDVIDAAFKLRGALFLTGTHLTVARTSFHRFVEYSKIVKTEDCTEADFKKEGSVKELKGMFLKAYLPGKV